jgi:hypothetical protein
VHLVRLVDDDEIDVWSLATGDRLDAAHLDRLIAIRALMDALHDTDAVNAFGLERGDCLVDERDRRHDERDALSLVESSLDDVRGCQSLAKACGSLKHRATLAACERAPEGIQGTPLMEVE